MQHLTFTSNVSGLVESTKADPNTRVTGQDFQCSESNLYKLLRESDEPDCDWRTLSQVTLEILAAVANPGPDELIVGSPDWIFICGGICEDREAILISRNSILVGVVQEAFGQLKLTIFQPLSARLIEALYEIAIQRGGTSLFEKSFKETIEVILWQFGLDTLGYGFEFVGSLDTSASAFETNLVEQQLIWTNCLPASYSAVQLRTLYKYG